MAHDVIYDDEERCWLASRDGEVLGRNHRIGPGEAFAARQWLAWLIGAEVPIEPSYQEYLDSMPDLPTTIGPGLGSRLMLELLARNSPGHRTDEFEMRPAGLLWAIACTSLGDAAALERARACPSGTSGGWAVDERHPACRCTDWPDTHRHLVFVAN